MNKEEKEKSADLGLTPQEKHIIYKIADIWNTFLNLKKDYGTNDLVDLRFHLDCIHRLIAARVAYRTDPSMWRLSDFPDGPVISDKVN